MAVIVALERPLVAGERRGWYGGGVKTDFMSRFGPLLFAAGGTVLVLWQMLLPGYVLTWDMTFGPAHVFPKVSGLVNGFPVWFLIYAVGFVMPMWAVQKAILVGLFFSLFYLPLRFFPFNTESWTRYAAASLYAVNPFVYERFLAGQWTILAAYALLAPFFYYLLELLRAPERRTALYLAATMLLIGVFSLHAFVMAALIAAAVVIVGLVRYPAGARPLAGCAALTGVIVAMVSLYWIVPYLMNPEAAPVPHFTEAHWSAFQTSADPVVFGNATGNVAMLYGFWGESYPWMQSLRSPKDTLTVFLPSLLALTIVIVVGGVALARKRSERFRALLLLAIGAAAFVFSVGLAPSVFFGFNLWLFEHVPFWRGFRDTEKWSMVLALIYAYFFAAGASYLVSAVRPKLRYVAQIALVVLPLVYTFTMLGGFAGQLRAVEYPAPWYEVNAFLEKDAECKALFLPCHQYYWLAFNDSRLTGNTAPRFFDCTIVSSADAEIGEVGDQGASPSYRAIADAVTNNNLQSVDDTLAVLRKEGIRYVIYTADVQRYDEYTYPFLDQTGLTKMYEYPVGNPVDNLHIVLIRL